MITPQATWAQIMVALLAELAASGFRLAAVLVGYKRQERGGVVSRLYWVISLGVMLIGMFLLFATVPALAPRLS